LINKTTIAGIDTIHKTGQSAKNAIVLLHGYGANYHDLLPLQKELDSNENSHWYFPNGIEPLPAMPGYEGRAWFQIDQAFINAQLGGEGSVDRRYKDVTTATAKVKSLFDEISTQHENVFIGGFSQGAILATNLAINFDVKPAGLIILSGAYLTHEHWQENSAKIAQIPVFQSHGMQDMVLPFVLAERLSEILSKTGERYEFHPFAGGHEIPYPTLLALDKFLKSNHAY